MTYEERKKQDALLDQRKAQSEDLSQYHAKLLSRYEHSDGVEQLLLRNRQRTRAGFETRTALCFHWLLKLITQRLNLEK